MSKRVYIGTGRLSSLVGENTEEGTYTIGMEPDAPVGGEYYHVKDDENAVNEGNTNFNGKLSYIGHYESMRLHENKYDDLFNQIIGEYQAFMNEKEKEYGTYCWYNTYFMNKEHPEVRVNPDDLKKYNELKTKSSEITRLWNTEGDKEKSEPKETNYDVISLAVEKFGITHNISQAGYILPDGSLLNFGSGGYRETDHRAIDSIYLENNIEIWDNEYRYNYVVDFMNYGAIRCDVNAGLLDMTNEPTKEQYEAIKRFVRYAEDIDMDFTDNKGNTEHSVSYTDAKPQRVVADIYKYYNEGIKPQGDVYESKKMRNENVEIEVAPSEVDLSSFEKRNELPSIWKGGDTLDLNVRLKLLDIADDFWDYVGISWVEPSGIIITGSLCNYNWSKFSDVDLHLIVDFRQIDDRTDFVKEYLDSKKNEWNDSHGQLKIYGYPVELYVQDISEDVQAGGIYDLEKNKWIRKPNANEIGDVDTDSAVIKDKAARIMTIIDDMVDFFHSTDDSHKLEVLGDDADKLWSKIKDMRKTGLANDGEMSDGNIVYKYMRRTNYLDKLFDLRTSIYDRVNTIFEWNESMKKYILNLKQLNEEFVADGSANGNPYEKRWKAEREALKNFISNFGTLMQSKEDNKEGRLYKVYYDKTISNLIGYNYCLCVQYDEVKNKPKSTVYVRAYDKFTPFIRRNLQFDDRGRDNERGTSDDVNCRPF